MRIALAHDYLLQQGGAERVLATCTSIWPHAPLYTVLHDIHRFPEFVGKDVRTSFLNTAPGSRRFFSWFLPLLPIAVESLNVQDFDVVLSSTSGIMKGLITHPHTLHICYCHTPTRYLWSETHRYGNELRIPKFLKTYALPPLFFLLRMWDRLSADRIHLFIANSESVRRRIATYYGKESIVIHPPVDIDAFRISPSKEKEYFLTGGRLVAYKRFDIVIDACTRTGKKLVVFGNGPEEEQLRKRAGKNITFVGRVSDDERAKLFAEAIAFLHPQEEDFGITAVESMASGRPVIAYAKGGALETVVEGFTGTFFHEQSVEEVMNTLLTFNASSFSPERIRKHAEKFSPHVFREKLQDVVQKAYRKHQGEILGER